MGKMSFNSIFLVVWSYVVQIKSAAV